MVLIEVFISYIVVDCGNFYSYFVMIEVFFLGIIKVCFGCRKYSLLFVFWKNFSRLGEIVVLNEF